MINGRALALGVLALLATPAWSATRQGRFDLSRPEIQSFIDEAVTDSPLRRAGVVKLLKAAHPQASILALVTRPPEQALPWWRYRAGFLTEARIQAGANLWRTHRAALERIAAARGVPPEYIVAILGCETFYGRVTGRNRALDALATLAFDYPPRSDFFRGELKQFLILAQEQKLNPRRIKGSYTGALGAPQFMPGSYRKFGVDADHDGRVNLWTDWDDIFDSVANYLQQSGWAKDQPALTEAQVAPDTTAKPIDKFEFTQTLDSLSAQGVHTASTLPGTTPAMLVEADQENGPAYRGGFQNFSVITRYNRSARYAMAVNDLAQAIATEVQGHAAGEPANAAAGATTGAERTP